MGNGIRAYNPAQLYIDGLRGQYSLGATQPNNILVAGDVFQFRWNDATRVCAIKKITFTWIQTVVSGATTSMKLDFFRANTWTVQSGQAPIVDISSGACKRRTSMPTSLMANGDIRICDSVDLNSSGTRTLEAQPFRSFVINGGILGQLGPVEVVSYQQGDFDYPLVFGFQEGFVARVARNAGNSYFTINVDWIETQLS